MQRGRTLSKRSKVNGLTNVKPGDGMLLYASGVGIIVCGVAQSTYTELLPNDVGADGVHTFWDVSLGDSWYKLANPISFQKMQILYGEIEVHQINSSVFPLTDIAAGKKLFAAAMKR
jgi:hypothetical protein